MRKLIVFMVAAAFVFSCALPAMAADKEVSFYGNVRMDTFWVDRDKNTANALRIPFTPGPAKGGIYDETDVFWDLCTGCSRFGARFKAGDVSANVEIRPNSASYFRQWWGSWNFGAGSLLVGQTWSPCFQGISNSVFDGGDGAAYGEAGGSLRIPMVQLSFPFEVGTLKIAFTRPGSGTALGNDTENMLPKIEANFNAKVGPVGFTVFGGYNWLDARDFTTDESKSVNGYLAGAVVNVPIGPAFFKASYQFAQNPNEYGLFLAGAQPFGATLDSNDNVQDVDLQGYFLVLGMKFTDMLAAEVGYGWTKTERDNNDTGLTDEDDKAFYYIQMPITLAKGVTVTPEIGKFDEKEHVLNGVTTDDGDAIYYGAYWRVDF